MSEKINTAELIEKEIGKQIDEMDKRIDRGGMLSLLLVVVAIFVLGYWVIDFFSLTDEESALTIQTQTELIERIDELESRIELLESQE